MDLLVFLLLVYADLQLYGHLFKPHQCILNSLDKNTTQTAICNKPFTKTWLWCSVSIKTQNVICSNSIAPDPLNSNGINQTTGNFVFP